MAWVVGALIVGALVVMWRRGGFALMRDEFPEFDLIVLIGSLILPWAAPFVIKLAGVSMEVQDINSYTAQQIQIVVTALIPFFAVSLTAGLLWDWKKWLVSNAIFYALFAFFFTTMFTNPNGVATGLVGSLGYWLEQQGVRRGNQPQYYYVGVILPMYEYLPIIGSVLGMGGGLTWFWRFRRNRLEEKRQAADAVRAEITNADETDAPTTTNPPRKSVRTPSPPPSAWTACRSCRSWPGGAC